MSAREDVLRWGPCLDGGERWHARIRGVWWVLRRDIPREDPEAAATHALSIRLRIDHAYDEAYAVAAKEFEERIDSLERELHDRDERHEVALRDAEDDVKELRAALLRLERRVDELENSERGRFDADVASLSGRLSRLERGEDSGVRVGEVSQ